MHSVLKPGLLQLRSTGAIRGLLIAAAAVWLAALLAQPGANPGRSIGAMQGHGLQDAWAALDYWAELGKTVGQL